MGYWDAEAHPNLSNMGGFLYNSGFDIIAYANMCYPYDSICKHTLAYQRAHDLNLRWLKPASGVVGSQGNRCRDPNSLCLAAGFSQIGIATHSQEAWCPAEHTTEPGGMVSCTADELIV